ncbi:unnamed protein product [Urochloa decumbens]|uniref:Uncharacterized protein n=1 Tax=Urochloa decumbens TaxID=240449 RepID=A0ABC9EW51_9POAL
MVASSSWQSGGGELILVAPHGRPITAYDALTGDVVTEFPVANTPRHGLAVAAATGPGGAASHVCPATGAGSIRLLQWLCPRRPPASFPSPSPSRRSWRRHHLLAGGASGRVHVLGLPSGAGAAASSFRAHAGGGGVSCLALNDDGSLLVSGRDDGSLAVFPLVRVVDADHGSAFAAGADEDLAIYRVAAHVAPVTCVACGRGGCNAVVASASGDGTCKLWRLADGAHLRTLALPCAAAALSLALDPTGSSLYAGGSDGGGSANAAAAVAVGVASGGRNLVSCSEDGEVRVWDLTRGLHLANVFWARGAVGGAQVVRRVASEVVVARGGGGAVRFRVRDGVVARTRAREMAEAGRMLRAEEGPPVAAPGDHGRGRRRRRRQ